MMVALASMTSIVEGMVAERKKTQSEFAAESSSTEGPGGFRDHIERICSMVHKMISSNAMLR